MELNKNERNDNWGIGIGLCFGSLGGFIVGMIINNIFIGFTLGATSGIVIGNIYDEIISFRNK